MATYRAKEYMYIEISFVMWTLCLLPFMPCATTLGGGPQDQTPNKVTTSPSQEPSIQTTGTIDAGGGTTAVTADGLCDTVLDRRPKNKALNEGDRVSLICDLNDDNIRDVIWKYLSGSCKQQNISINDHIYPERCDYNKNNYKISFNESLQTYKLVIKAATFSTDSGIYECGYECGPDRRYIPLATAMITVRSKDDSSLSCRMNLLPSLKVEYDTFEILCIWSQGHAGEAHFYSASGEVLKGDLDFTDRIISRIKSHKVPNITCHFISSESPSKTMDVPCIGDNRARKVRVDPFINEVTVGSNASFNCSSFNQSSLPTAPWKTHNNDVNVSPLVTSERVIQNQDVISILNVSKSDQTLLVECSLPVSENMTVSSFGALRIVEMTTPFFEIQTRLTTDENSRSTNKIIQSSRPTTVTKTFSMASTLNVGSAQTSAALSCQLYRLPHLESVKGFEFEIMCSWTPSQEYQAYFERSSGEAIDDYLTFPNHIISRVNSRNCLNITCRSSLDANASLPVISTQCIKGYAPKLVRVDPFISKVDVGSTALLQCTFNDKGHASWLFFKVHSSGNVSFVNNQSEKHEIVSLDVHERGDGQSLVVECNIQLSENNNISGYGVLRVIEGTTQDLTTPFGSEIMGNRSERTVEFTTHQNSISQTQSSIKVTTSKLPNSSSEGQTSDITYDRFVESTTDEDNITATQPVPSKKGIIVTVLASVVVALIIILLSIFIVYLLRKQRRISSRRQLTEDGTSDAIELSKIPHILHEESSQWYALSLKDKRVRQHHSNDAEVKHQDGDNLNSLFSSCSLGLMTLPPSESTNEHMYSEPGVTRESEEPIRETISRHQCTFTPLREGDEHDEHDE